MPRIRRTKEEYERFLIRRFLVHLGYTISAPTWPDRPDAVVTIRQGRLRKRIAVEHTDYFKDTVAGKRSPLTPLAEFWNIVQSSLVRRTSHRRHLTGVVGRVRFKDNLPRPSNATDLARGFAQELVRLVEAHPVAKNQNMHVWPRDLDGYPTLRRLLAAVSFGRWTHDSVPALRSSWGCSNLSAGGMHLSLHYIESAIESKNKKAAKYDWHDAKERWLLIAASGRILSNRAGPPFQFADDARTRLRELCRISPFHRIVFWEYFGGWCKWLKPDRLVVRF